MEGKKYLFPADYMADPAAHVFNGKLFIYPSHDWEAGAEEDDDGGHFQMKDYHALSFDDLENGQATDHGVIFDVNDVPWAEKQLWDSDVVEKDGKYYYIFSAKGYDGVFRLGVAIADNPEGPFKPQPQPIRGSFSIDPCAFKDDDGQIYVYFGGLWGGQLQWAQPFTPGFEPVHGKHGDENGNPLKADDPHRFFEASWMHKYKGKYYFSYSTGDSHFLCYATGDNPYGPFTYQGVILTPVVGWTTHHSIIEYKGKWYLFHHDSVPSGGKSWLRSLKVCEIEYDAQGKIKTIEGIDKE